MVDRRLPFRDIALGGHDQGDIALANLLADHAVRPIAKETGRRPDEAALATSLNQPFAKGAYLARTIRSDLQFTRATYEVQGDFTGAVVKPPHLHIGVYFEGGGSYQLGGAIHRPPRAIPIMIWHGRTTEVVAHHRSGERVAMAGLYVGHAFFEGAGDERPLNTLDDLRRRFGSEFAFQELPNSEALGSILRRLYTCPCHGFMEALQIESLCLSAIVALMGHVQGAERRCLPIPVSRRGLAQEARELLEADPDAVPSTHVLAQRLATNETTLRRSFKTAFGTTIADYVRNRRLDTARIFVRDTSLQIAQIAYRTGYSDPANFTTAYRRRFGCSPTCDRPSASKRA